MEGASSAVVTDLPGNRIHLLTRRGENSVHLDVFREGKGALGPLGILEAEKHGRADG